MQTGDKHIRVAATLRGWRVVWRYEAMSFWATHSDHPDKEAASAAAHFFDLPACFSSRERLRCCRGVSVLRRPA